jgi:hypothetical protein
MGLAPPQGSGGPILPSLPPMIPKQGSQGGKGNGPSLLQQSQTPGHSQPGSMSSHGGSVGSMREAMGNQNPPEIWTFMRDMEGRMRRMEEDHEKKVKSLQDEVTTLRAQLAQQHAANHPQQQGQ